MWNCNISFIQGEIVRNMKEWTEYDWSDLEPRNLEPPVGAIAQISYSDEYLDVTGYLRSAQEANEKSERVLALCAAVLSLNPAHYSAWDYWLENVRDRGVDVDLREWIDEFTLDNPKSYQVWAYRQRMCALDNEPRYREELATIKLVLEDDAKNFHAWSQLRWVVEQVLKSKNLVFSMIELLDVTNVYINSDVYNNSAWSFREFVYETWKTPENTMRLFVPEKEYVLAALHRAPDNEAAWSYLKGICDLFLPEQRAQHINGIAIEFRNQPRAIELLAENHARAGEHEEAIAMYEFLCNIEPVRKGYYRYLIAEQSSAAF